MKPEDRIWNRAAMLEGVGGQPPHPGDSALAAILSDAARIGPDGEAEELAGLDTRYAEQVMTDDASVERFH